MAQPIKDIILNFNDLFFPILMKWGAIVGETNKKMMMPLQLKRGVLTVAVPNNVVLSCAVRFRNQIVKNSDKELAVGVVSRVKFILAPEKFKTASEKFVAAGEAKREILLSDEEIASKAKDFSKRFNLGGPLAFSLARLALFMQKSDNDTTKTYKKESL